MSKPVTAGTVFGCVVLFVLLVLPLVVVGLFFLWQGKGVERVVGAGFPLAVAFGISQSLVRKLNGK